MIIKKNNNNLFYILYFILCKYIFICIIIKEKLFNYNCKKKSLKKSLKNDIYGCLL